MHSALFVAAEPIGASPLIQLHWKRFLEAAEHETKNTNGAQRLAGNVWLLDMLHGLSALVALGEAASSHQFAYKVMFMEEPPVWAESAPRPEEP